MYFTFNYTSKQMTQIQIHNLIYLLKTINPEIGYILWQENFKYFKYRLNDKDISKASYNSWQNSTLNLEQIKKSTNLWLILPKEIKLKNVPHIYTNNLTYEIAIHEIKSLLNETI